MTTLLDTSVVVRYLVGTPVAQAERARTLIESEQSLALPVVALAETAFVLCTTYAIARPAVVDALVGLLSRPNVTVHDVPKAAAIEALLLCQPSSRVSFADALIWAAARTTPERRVVTFDQRFPSVGVQRDLLD